MYNADAPVQNQDGDKLGRASFAKHLANAVMQYKATDSVCIGLLGKWGSGKTSVINMLISEIDQITQNSDEKEIMVCRFEPWNFTGTDQLLQQFFVMLSSAFERKAGEVFKKISKGFKQYGESIIDIASLLPLPEPAGAVGRVLVRTVSSKRGLGDKDILQQKQDITSMLLKLKHKVLIVIDDIDRLSNDQIQAVFQLVTAVAKLPNLMYLLSFDRHVVVEALSKIQNGDGEAYLEKVIQIPISLPEITDQQKINVLFAKLDNVLKITTEECLHMDRWQTHFSVCIEPFIHGIRDINRLCNVLIFKLGAIGSEVDFLDIVCITLIELTYPQVFQWCNDHKSILTGEHDLSYGRENEEKIVYKEELSALLPEDEREKNIDCLISALAILFPHFAQKMGKVFSSDNNRMRRYNQIAVPEKFSRYFQLNPDNIALTSGVINSIIFDADTEELKSSLLDYDKRGILPELISEIQSRIPSISLDRAKQWIKALFAVSSECHSRNSYLLFDSSSWMQMMIRDLMNKYNSEEECYEYVHNILLTASWAELKSIASFINITELSYGRLAANGEPKDYIKLISEKQLEELEEQFCNYVKSHIETIDILSDDTGQFVFGLMLQLDKPWIDNYMSDIQTDDIKALKYLRYYIVSGYAPYGEFYQLPDDYGKLYITEAQAREAATRLKANEKDLSLLPSGVKTSIAILDILPVERNHILDDVSKEEIDELIATWDK